jgi:two-component system response regulator FixJ
MPERPTVYVVDDDDAVRDSVRLLLETNGQRVRTFAMAADLLSALPAALVGCLVLDYQMSGTNGLELIAALRTRNVNLPVILITGACNPGIRRRAKQAGVSKFLEKPFADGALLEAIREAMGSAR